MHSAILSFIYLMFFASGAAALMYQVVWVRSLALVFGGSHLAVTTVLSVFMAGLAIGGYGIGKYVDRFHKPLLVYGLLELGIALFAGIFLILMKIYPWIYILLAQGYEHHPFYLSFIRTVFSVAALIVPTSLMGGTLPVLSRFISRHPGKIGRHLSFLYGLNTLGAVVGAGVTGFFLLRIYSVSTTFWIAMATNLSVAAGSFLIQAREGKSFGLERNVAESPQSRLPMDEFRHRRDGTGEFPLNLILWGIGVSGFCALGYEVLWTRILTIVVGASVYGFTTMLVAFLAGIALGSSAFGLILKLFSAKLERTAGSWFPSIMGFGAVQILIGTSALLVTFYIRYLPVTSLALQEYFSNMRMEVFAARLGANFVLAFGYMFVPAFFMGLAFPLAGKVHAEYRQRVGSAVGEILAYNTIGALLGAAVSGFFMIYLLGIERSLQLLTMVNIGLGLLALASPWNTRGLNWGIPGLVLTGMLLLAVHPHLGKMWDEKFFAIFRNNQPEAFRTPEMTRDALENTDVLFYGEGSEATISSIKVKGGEQSVLVNGKVVASTHLEGQQCQLTLGHLPMLLHPNPQKVLVVGLGTGMTLGATSVHPQIRELTLAEIEPMTVPAARTFGLYNHYVLDNPKLKIVYNDGRNFLMTTEDRYDVITADPIHPWAQGASYLYTTQYFKMASERLLPGGIMCQWLPIYEMSEADLRSVVRTFSLHFRYTMLWLTHNDAELIGSNDPILIDEALLERRMSPEAVSADLKRVMMGTGREFLSYFVLGTEGLKAFSRGGTINTDNNLYLEFSTPLSVGINLMRKNAVAITTHRESILPYLRLAADASARAEQQQWWLDSQKAARVYDMAHAIFLGKSLVNTPQFAQLMKELDTRFPWFAPGRFLKNEYLAELYMQPRLMDKTALTLTNEQGGTNDVEISAVLAPVSKERAAVVFVNNAARVIYGQVYIDGLNQDDFYKRLVKDVMGAIHGAYQEEVQVSLKGGRAYPSAKTMTDRIRKIITARAQMKGQP